VSSLGYDLKYRPATDKLLVLLKADPDADVRNGAASAFNIIWQGSKNGRVLQALGDAALHDPDEDIRRSAYGYLQIVNGVSRDEHLEPLIKRSIQVDPRKVEAILNDIR
jgi:hypothetical protein